MGAGSFPTCGGYSVHDVLILLPFVLVAWVSIVAVVLIVMDWIRDERL